MQVYIVVARTNEGFTYNIGVFGDYESACSLVGEKLWQNLTFSFDIEHWIDGEHKGGGYFNELKPTFHPEKDSCRFLGHYNGHDLWYIHNSPDVLCRYGNDPSEYKSGYMFSSLEIKEAVRRAKVLGFEFPSY